MEKKRKKAVKSSKKVIQGESGSVSYRLKCAKTANGLSHFVMYGDVQVNKALL